MRRSSNFELYRIFSMLAIVASHFVVNSNIVWGGKQIYGNIESNTIYLLLLGMWGKVGINCFVLITGYFMCKGEITVRKFVKLLGQIYFYRVTIYLLLLSLGMTEFSLWRMKNVILPIWGLTSNFVSCFIVFWLTIPFWNVLIRNINHRQHIYLLSLLIGCYTICGSIPVREGFPLCFNYVSWFGVIYLIASYVRLYPHHQFDNKRLWLFCTLTFIILAMMSVVWIHRTKGWNEFFYVMDSNKILAVLVSVSSFLYVKNVRISYNKWINLIGSATFGVLLIHANCDEVRKLLWSNILDCVHCYNLPLPQLVCFSVKSIVLVFAVCAIIDLVRQKLIEKNFFKWFDKKYRV